jgi:penicillin-binding protein 1B
MPKSSRRKKKPKTAKGTIKKWLVASLRLLLSRLALKIYLVLSIALLAFVIYLDATIRSTFEGKKWQLPARVYARPLELHQGLLISADQLESELRDLGYQSGRATEAGNYFRRTNELWLYSRGYQFWDGQETPQQAKISFSKNAITQLQRLDGSSLPLLRLEPMEIGAIYPAHREDRILLQLEDVPPLLSAALLVVEDHRFYEHHGVSPVSIARAALQNVLSGAVVQGGSTITQQLVKNYYLSHKRTVSRKATEAIMALLLEFHYEKEPILEAYLNEVYLGQAGARAIHGFGLAAQHYFNRPVNELSVEKLALLVALVRGPAYYDPWRHPKRAIKRRNFVIDTLVKHGLLGEHDAQWAVQQPLNLGKKTRSHFVFPAYIDLVKRQLVNVYDTQDLTSNGLKIYTSFDPIVQRAAETAVQDRLKLLGDDSLQAAVVVTEPATGEVLAMVGSNTPRYAGFNRALNAVRSIGSTIKPFVYLTALAKPEKYTLATLIDDSPIEISSERDGEPQVWSPRNFDRKNHGEVPIIAALANSYNQATARLGDQLGIDAVVSTLYAAGLQRKANAVPSLFIGTTQLSPFEVTQLYQSLAAGGFHTPLKAIRSVLDDKGQPLQRFGYEVQQTLNSSATYLVQRALIHAGKQGSARYASSQLPANFLFAGKTGTSGEQRDSWFAGFTGDMLAVVWLGHDDNTPTRFTGSAAALRVWTQLIKTTSRKPLAPLAPAGIVSEWIDLPSGQRSYRGCTAAIKVPFAGNTQPDGKRVCTRP